MGPYVTKQSTNTDPLSNLAAGPLDEYHLVRRGELQLLLSTPRPEFPEHLAALGC